MSIILKDRKNNSANGTTDKSGVLILPAETHTAYIFGYADGTFKGDNAITRAEVVTVVNRATSRKADEEYITKNISVLNKFTDIRNNSMWYYSDVMEAANSHLANTANNAETWVK